MVSMLWRSRSAGSRVVVGAVAMALAWAGLPSLDAVAEGPVKPSERVPAELLRGEDGLVSLTGVAGRPDWVSASVTARASGAAVEVLSERSGSRRVFVFPDGHVSEEVAGGPVQVERAGAGREMSWVRVDTTLQRGADGVVRPKAVKDDMSLSNGGAAPVVSMVGAQGAGAGVEVALEGVTLPGPELDGATATYRDVFRGVDVRVEARPAGFELVWLVKSAQGVASLVSKYGAAGEVSLPTVLSTTGDVEAAQSSDGVVELVDRRSHKAVSRLAAPVLFDSATVKVQGRGTPKAARFVLGARSQVAGVAAGKRRTRGKLAVVADAAWLQDKSRVFPITIDPTYGVASGSPVFDTFVQQGYTTDQSTSGELKVGNNGSGQVARSFLNFDAALFKGRTIMSASMSLSESYSWSCTARAWSAYDAGLATASSRWTAQPTIGAKRATSTETRGYSSACPGGRVSIDMTAQAKAWSSTSAAQVGLMLRADDETDPYGWKRFHSDDSSYPPVLTVNYDRAPAKPNWPSVSGSTTHNSVLYTSSATPKLEVVRPSDPDGNGMSMQFGLFASAANTSPAKILCTSGGGAAGTVASCVPTALADNQEAWLGVRGFDGSLYGPWSALRQVRVTLSAPEAPEVSCPSLYGSWGAEVAPAEACTVTLKAVAGRTLSAPVRLRYKLDSAPDAEVSVTQPTSSTPTKVTLPTVGGTAGRHTVNVYAYSPVGRVSSKLYEFGYGSPSITAPVDGQTTTDTFGLNVQGAPAGGKTVTSQVRWRMAGGTDQAWKDLPAEATSGLVVDKRSSGTGLTGVVDLSAAVGTTDGDSTELRERVPAVVEVRACLSYDGKAVCSDPRRVVKVPSAFGQGFPTADAGPGQVGLWTGELQISETDAELPGPMGGISVSRTHSSFAGDTATSPFGPGWTSSLEAGEDGLSGAQVFDNTLVDGTVAVVSAEGDVLVFAAPARRAASATALAADTYTPVDEDTATSGITLKVSGTSTATVELTSEDGVTTRFTGSVTAGQDTNLQVQDVQDAVTGDATSYVRDRYGRVTAIVAPVAEGVPGCAVGTPTKGCRILKLAYDAAGRITDISAQVDETKDRPLSSYEYNPETGRMLSQTDEVTGLITTYRWADGPASRLTWITPPGEDTYEFTYANNKLSKVERALPSTVAGGGKAQLAAYVYDAGLDASDFDLGQFDDYPLTRRATKAFAVFGPDQPITTTPAKGDQAWHRAQVQLTDDEGWTIHDGSYGGGAWQWSATVYDDQGNTTDQWDDQATASIRAGEATDIPAAATHTDYNSDISVNGKVVTPAGTLVTRVTGPARWMADSAGKNVWARPVTDTSYDEGAPNSGINPKTNQPYRLPTTLTMRTIESTDAGWTTHEQLGTVKTGYALAATSVGVTGWDLGQATSTTTVTGADGTGITRETVYDGRGRLVEQRQPSAAGKSADPGTRRTVYYTVAANETVPACGGKPAWAGWVCQTMPGAGTLPVERTTSYTWDGQAVQTQTIAGATVVTTDTTYDAKSRPVTVTTTSTGLTGSTSVPAVTTTYDAVGRVTGTTSSAGSTAMTYDTWGRQLTYTNTPAGQAADTATTTYDPLGQVIKVTDNQGETRYTYDGTDANGHEETRGLVTKVEQSAGGITHSATAAYDAQGKVTIEKLPGGITRRHGWDAAGELVDLVYSGLGTDPDTGATVDDQPWFGWSATSDAAGRTVREWSTDGGSAYTATTGVQAVRSDRYYTYDKAGRLVGVDDITGNPGPDGAVPCVRRGYGFDPNGNRTSQTRATNTACTDTGTSTLTRAYNGADQPTTGANAQGNYTYDPLGRQTSIPAADTANPSLGDMALGYYDTDAAQSITQGDVRTTFTLDGAGRRLVQDTTVGPVVVPGAVSGQVVRHYIDASDNPAWTVDTRDGIQTTTRFGALTGDGLGITFTTTNGTTTPELALAGLRGDVNATVTLDGTNPATGIDAWNDWDEYGQPRQPVTTNTGGAAGAGYGWLGAHERATLNTLGITLMGARLYNQTTGLFTSLDPQYEGGDTAYGYPNDPINTQDLDGNRWWGRVKSAARAVGRTAWKYKWDIALTALSFVPVFGAARVGYTAYRIARAARAGQQLNRFGRVSRLTSRVAGRIYTGRGSFVRGGYRYSRDMTRRYRPPAWKVHRGTWQSNFERTTRPGVSNKSWKYPQRDYNGHLYHGRFW